MKLRTVIEGQRWGEWGGKIKVKDKKKGGKQDREGKRGRRRERKGLQYREALSERDGMVQGEKI